MIVMIKKMNFNIKKMIPLMKFKKSLIINYQKTYN